MRPSRFSLLSMATTALLLPLALGACAGGDEPAEEAESRPPIIPISDFFDNPEVAGAQIAPDGEWISYLKPVDGKLNIVIRRPGETTERIMTRDTIRPVTGYMWAGTGDYLIYVQDKGGNENYHLYRVPVAGEGEPQATDLTPFDGVRAVIFALPFDYPDSALVGLNRRDPSAFDPYWLQISTGELTMAEENPGRVSNYMVDDENRIVVTTAQTPIGDMEIRYRAPGTNTWNVVATYPSTENVGTIRLHPDGERLYLNSNHGGTDLSQLVLLNLVTGEEELVESDPEGEVDLSGVMFSDLDDEILATIYIGDTVRIYPKRADIEQALADVRELNPGSPNLGASTRDERLWVVSFDSPTDPGPTYLYDKESGESEFLYRPRPWLNPDELADMRPVSFESRDGLTIHGYLTVPKGMQAKNLPMVLLVHGGPWARDVWGYDPEVQMLANRGYAVLQVNYRGSAGYGKAFFNAAEREFAGKMHDDLIDGVQWAIDQGIADPAKVAIYGGSYGGYATLVGVTFTPEVFACGVDYVGPSSLITLIESFPAYWRPFLEGSWYRFVGDPADEADREDMRARSPLFFVDQIEDPLLIVQGANDPRVTKREADQLAIALRDRGIDVKYILADNEGHGFANADNRMALYRSMELFLADCLGGRVQDAIDPAVTEQIESMTVDVSALTLQEEAE